jgi:hypothetical protein
MCGENAEINLGWEEMFYVEHFWLWPYIFFKDDD